MFSIIGFNDFSTIELYVTDKLSRVKTTYDGLVDNYVSDGVGAGVALVDYDYCETVLQAFSRPVDESIDYEAAKTKSGTAINYIKDRMSDLFNETAITIDDYNNTNASKHIEYLSGLSIKKGISAKFYLLVAAAVGLLFGMFLAIAFEILVNMKKVFSNGNCN